MEHHPEILSRDQVVLVVVDVQEKINRVMADQSHVPRVRTLIEAFGLLGLPVLATEQYPEGLGVTLADLGEALPSPPLVKSSFSCGGDEAFAAEFESLEREQVLLCGVEAHVCVLQTALDLEAAGYQVQVPHDAINSRRPADRDWALRRMARADVVITSTESALFELLDRCDGPEFKPVSKLVKQIG